MTCFPFMKSRLIVLSLGLCCLWFSAEQSAVQARNSQNRTYKPSQHTRLLHRAKLQDKVAGRLIRVDFTHHLGKNIKSIREMLANPDNLRESDPVFDHAIRIQAQGGGLEKSVTIQKNSPITRREARLAMSALANHLDSGEQKIYQGAFVDASKKLTEAARNGGIRSSSNAIQGLSPHNIPGERRAHVPGNEVRIDVNFLRGFNLEN